MNEPMGEGVGILLDPIFVDLFDCVGMGMYLLYGR